MGSGTETPGAALEVIGSVSGSATSTGSFGKVTVGTTVGIGTVGGDSNHTLLYLAKGNNSAGDMWTQIGIGNAPHMVIQNTGTTSNNNAGYFFKDNDGFVGGVGMRFTDHNPNQYARN